LESSAERADLVSRAVGASNDVATMVRLQSRTLAIQKATLRNGRSTRALTSQMLATANRIMALTVELLDVARQTLAHTANLDRKVP
jgi:hypothetical protein